MPTLLSQAQPPQPAVATAPEAAAGTTLWGWSSRSGRLRCLARGPGLAGSLLPVRPQALVDWWRGLPDDLRGPLQAAWTRLQQGEPGFALHWTDHQGQRWQWQAQAQHGRGGALLKVHGWLGPAQADPSAAGRTQLALVSHELRTPLNAIMGFCALAQQQPDDAACRSALGQIDQASQLMRRVIDDLLDLERLEAGALNLGTAKPLQVSALICRVLALAAGLPARPEVALHASMAPGVPDTVVGHAQRLEQILLNLVANALRHTDSGVVQLSVRPQRRPNCQDLLRWSVADTGLGMDLQALHRIAQPFAQLGDDLARRRGGSGLGLVVVQRLLALQGSGLQVASMPGGGTTVWFDLPLPSTEPAADAALAAPAAAASPAPLPCTTLLCTPDERLQHTLALQWQAQGQRLRACSLADLQRLAGVALGDVRHWLIDDRLPPGDQALARQAARGAGVQLWRVHPCPAPAHRQGQAATANGELPCLHAALAARTVLAEAHKSGPHLAALTTADQRPVLVVEDNLLNQRVFEGLLQHLGLRCHIASDLTQARALAARHRYALALVDRELPDGDGLDLLREWQQASPAPWPAVLASAHLDADHQAQAMACGALGCLQKPFDAAALQGLLVGAGVLALRNLPPRAPPLPDLMPLFLRQRAALLAPIEAAWASGDSPTLQRAVHALRGALALLPGQAQVAAGLAQQVEQGLHGQVAWASLPVDALLHSARSLQSAA